MWAVLDYTETHTIQCKLLIKVSILSLEYLNDQLASRPSHEPCASHCAHTKQSKLNHGLALAHQFEGSKSHITIPSSPSLSSSPVLLELATVGDVAEAAPGAAKLLTLSKALCLTHQYLQSLHILVNQFSVRTIDISEHSIIVEMSSKMSHVEAFLSLVKLFGIIKLARTGMCPLAFALGCNASGFAVVAPSATPASSRLGQWLHQWGKVRRFAARNASPTAATFATTTTRAPPQMR